MTDVIERLAKKAEEGKLTALDLDYCVSAQKFLEAHPRQAVAVLGIGSPGAYLLQGVFNPDNVQLVVGKRSPNRWGAGTWAPPMGKVEAVDVAGEKKPLGNAVVSAARREFGEEVHGDEPDGFEMVAGSFKDEQTGILIHVVIKQMVENEQTEIGFRLELPDTREHDQLAWHPLAEIPTLDPMMPGTAKAIQTGLEFLKDQNARLKESGRWNETARKP